MSSLPPLDKPDPSDPAAVEIPRHLSVLVVDDVEEVRKLYARYFGFHGLNVVTAADGFEALDVTSHLKPDVIVLDMSLPRMTGWEMLERLRADPNTRNIPVVVLTGALFAGSQGDAFRAGADSYLAKPCPPGVVLAEILRLTGGPAPSQA